MQNNLITSWFHNRDYLNSLSRDVLFFTPTPRMTGFQIGGFGFFFKNADQILTLRRQIFQMCCHKNEPLGFLFTKNSNKNLRVQISVIIWGWGGGGGEGGADNKWNVPKALLG